MTVEEIIAKLQKFPPHFEVQAILVIPEDDDLVADFVDIVHPIEQKIVYLELADKLRA